MMKILALFVLATVIYAQSDEQSKITNISIDSLPGVSNESIERLRQMLTPPPSSIEKVKEIAEQWIASLPQSEKEAIRQHIEEMRRKLNLGNRDIKTN